MGELDHRRMRPEEHRDEQEAAKDEEQRKAFEAAEIPRAGCADDDASSGNDTQFLRQSQIVERQTDADELGDDRQRVQQEEVDHAESAPEPPEALENEPSV